MTLLIRTNRKFEEISREYIDDGSEPDLDKLIPVFAEGFIDYMKKNSDEYSQNI